MTTKSESMMSAALSIDNAIAANARLTSAAPDLLQACKASIAEITGGSMYPESLRPGNERPLEMMKAAVAKAEAN